MRLAVAIGTRSQHLLDGVPASTNDKDVIRSEKYIVKAEMFQKLDLTYQVTYIKISKVMTSIYILPLDNEVFKLKCWRQPTVNKYKLNSQK